MNNKYDYQLPAAQSIFDMATSGKYAAAVLGAACNAGKSTIVIHILNLFFSANPDYKIIILAHNQNILKDQMLEDFNKGLVETNFTFGEFGSNSQVEVGIPSSRKKIKACDVLIVDEAHQYYMASMIKEIVAKFQPKAQVLMTGTPSEYNRINHTHNRDVYGVHYISGEELMEKDVYSEIIIDIAEQGSTIVQSYINVINKSKKDYRFNDSKLMIACKNVEDAYDLGAFLKTIGRKIAISTAESDEKNVQIRRFKSGEADTLIVVNKGILGFSDNLITAVIDLKCTKDLDGRSQLFGRGLRKHPNNLKKFYVSVSTKQNMNKECALLQQVVGLMKLENFRRYT